MGTTTPSSSNSYMALSQNSLQPVPPGDRLRHSTDWDSAPLPARLKKSEGVKETRLKKYHPEIKPGKSMNIHHAQMFFPETSDLVVYAKAKKYAIINTHQCVNKSLLAISVTALVSMHVHVLLYHEKPLAPSMEVWYNRVSRETILLNTATFSQSTRENRWQFSFSRL